MFLAIYIKFLVFKLQNNIKFLAFNIKFLVVRPPFLALCARARIDITDVVYNRDKVIYGSGVAFIDRKIKTKTTPLGGRGY